MRRIVALVLVALGVFLAVLAITVKTYVEPRAVRVPLDQTGQSIAESDGRSTVLDAGALTVKENLTLKARREVRGDVAAAKASKRSADVAVWKTTNILTDDQGNVVNVTSETVALDRRTGEAVNCCGEEVGGDTSVRHDGLFLKFPFDTRKTTYDFWDSTALAAFPMKYVDTQTRNGLTTYHFSQTVPATTLRTVSVPGSLVGQDPSQVVETSVVYSNVREVWVEPTSGVIVHGQEQPKQVLVDPVGNEVLTAFQANIGWTAQTQAKQTALAKDTKAKLTLLRTTLPLGAGLLGVVLFLAGMVVARGVGRGSGRRVDLPPSSVDVRGADVRSDVR